MKLSFLTNRQYREEKVLSWISVGLLFFVTAFLWMPKRDGLSVVFALGFFIPLLCVLPFRKPEFKRYGGWFTGLALIFAAYSVLTSLWAPIAKVEFFIIQWLILAVWLVGISWLASQRKVDWFKLQEWLLIIGALTGVVTIIFFYGNHSFLSRMEGFFAAKNPNEIGAVFGILTLLAFCQWLRVSGVERSLHYGLLTVILCLPLILSQSRSALLGLVVTILMAIFYIRPTRYKIFILVSLMLLGVVILGFMLAYLPNDRLGAGFRHIIWQEVFTRSVNEHLWFGIGMEKFEKIIIPDVDVFDHAHNVWLDTFYHTGLVGLILALIHVFFVLKKFKPTHSQIPVYLWLMFSLITSMFDYRTFFWQIDTKWFFFWIPIGLIMAMHVCDYKAVNTGSRNDQ